MCVVAYLAELSNVADPLALERSEVLGDSTVLEVDDTSEGLIKERSNGGHREVASFGLQALISSSPQSNNLGCLTARV